MDSLVKKKFYIFIQARVKSTRLPGKLFLKFHKTKIIDRIINIAKNILPPKNIFLLTGNLKENLKLKKYANKNKINFFLGDEKNVYLRFMQAINYFNLENQSYIIRITADNYLIQPNIIKEIVRLLNKKKYDYMYVKPLSHFAGEIISTQLLKKNFEKKISLLSKEHVTWDIRRDKKNKIKSLHKNFCGIDHSYPICLDYHHDYIILKKIERKFKYTKNLNFIKSISRIQKFLKSS